MTRTNISLTILAGLIAILGLGYLLLTSEVAAIRKALRELESETTKELDGQFDLAKRLERGLGLLEARVAKAKPTEAQELGEKCRLTTLTLYPKGPNEL